MTDPFDILLLLILVVLFSNLTYQFFRRKKYFNMKKTIELELKNQDAYYWSRAVYFIVMALWIWKRLYYKDADYFSYFNIVLIISIGIILLKESRNTFFICDNGIFLPNRFIDWNDLVDCEWETMFNKNFERIKITSKRRPALFLLKEYELKMKLPITDKEQINEIIKDKTKSMISL